MDHVRKTMPHQVDVVKDECGFVHLAEDQQHLVVNEFFVLLKVTIHLLLQLRTNLIKLNLTLTCVLTFFCLHVK